MDHKNNQVKGVEPKTLQVLDELTEVLNNEVPLTADQKLDNKAKGSDHNRK